MARKTSKPPPEMIEFMDEIKAAVEKLIGEEGKVSLMADADNGVFCMTFAISSLPNMLIMSTCISILSNMLNSELADAYHKANQIGGKMPERVM